ncbi:MAG: thioredoxin family protein [Deltaproteobacteria bacterium]|nr:thioredoxin family protein [Deltaproteobacteria bacterium]
MKIKILGPACVNCLKLELLVAQAVKELDLEAEIEKITDHKVLSKYNVEPPAIIVNDRVLSAGLPLPSLVSIKNLLNAR